MPSQKREDTWYSQTQSDNNNEQKRRCVCVCARSVLLTHELANKTNLFLFVLSFFVSLLLIRLSIFAGEWAKVVIFIGFETMVRCYRIQRGHGVQNKLELQWWCAICTMCVLRAVLGTLYIQNITHTHEHTRTAIREYGTWRAICKSCAVQ